MSAFTVQIRSRGRLTLPGQIRRKYGLQAGDIFTIIDLGDGALVLTPHLTRVDQIGNRIARLMAEQGVSGQELFSALDEERERYFQERWNTGGG
jgi:AbrB family looped-hinge helix DNA binding protein